jgi:hypothetical protein
VRLKTAGNVLEVRYAKRESECKIKKLNRDEYLDLTTGAIEQFDRSAETRADNLITVSQTLRNLRDTIRANCTNPERCLWVTLTYRENMRDTKRLYNDLTKYTKRFRYYLTKHEHPSVEYIYAVEPQGRGAYHAHCIFIFNADKAPFIPNKDMARLWSWGFTKTKSMTGIRDQGLYFSAYLTDLDLAQAVRLGVKLDEVKEVETTDEQGNSVRKAVVKGGRLHLYPKGFRLYRVSRGVQRPTVQHTTEGEAMQIVGDAPLTFERTIKVSGVGDTYNTINYRQFTR